MEKVTKQNNPPRQKSELMGEQEQALSESKPDWMDLLESRSDAIYIVDENNIVRYANPAAGDLEKDSCQDLMGKPLSFAFSLGEVICARLALAGEESKELEVFASPTRWLDDPASFLVVRDQTEIRRASESLLREHNFLQAMIDHIPDIIFVKDKKGNYILGNEAWNRLAGNGKARGVNGMTDYDLYPVEIADQYRANDSDVLLSGKPLLNVEEPNLYPDGSLKWALISKIPLFNNEGSLIGLLGIGRDITDRKLSEARLAHERNLLETLINNLPDMIFIKDRQSRFMLGNRTLCNILGVKDPEDLIGKSDADFFPAELAERFFNDDQDVMNCNEPLVDREEPVLLADGTWRWFWTTKIPFKNESGEIQGLVAIGHDITERKRMEEALDQERSLLRTLIDSLPDSVYIKDTNYRKILANQADLSFIGIPYETDVLGKTDFEIYPREIAQKFYDDDSRVIESGKSIFNHEELIFDRNGGAHWLLTTKMPLRNSNGEMIGLLGIGRDITERKAIEQVLEQERSLLRMLIDSLPDNIYIKDKEGRKLIANKADVEYMGLRSEAEAIGKTDFDIFPPDLAEKFHHDDLSVMESGEAMVGREEPAYNSADGEERWLLTSKFPLRNADGVIIGLLGIGRDITVRKKTEQALLHAYEILEQRVEERTAELAAANKELRSEIAERTRLEKAERRRVRELEALRATMTDISAELELAKLLQAVVERVMLLLGADFAEMALYNEERGDLETVVGSYEDIDFVGERTRLGEGALGRAAITRHTILIDNYSTWEGRLNTHPSIRPFSGIYSPLMAGNRLMGVVGVGVHLDKRNFNEQDMHLLEMFAQQAAIAIQNAHLFSEVQRLAITDSLTGIYNRRYFMERASNEFVRARRYRAPLSVIMLDLDHFKQVNDTYGHLAGDQVLQKIASLCAGTLRLVDIIGRYGGEEFMIMLPETSQEKAIATAERLRAQIAAASVPSENGVIRITASLGVAELTDEIDSLDGLLLQADRALYLAKDSGRNQVVMSETGHSKHAER